MMYDLRGNEPLRAFNEQAGITHNDAVSLESFIVEMDAATSEVTIYGNGEMVPLSPREAYRLLDFLYEHHEALQIGPYMFELDSETAEMSIHGGNELVRLSPDEAYGLLDFLYQHRDALREASHTEQGEIR